MDETKTIPWYQSKIIQRLALSIVVQILSMLHLSKWIMPELGVLVNNLLEVAGIALAVWAVHARVAHPVPPVALTKASADVVNGVPKDSFTQPKENER